MRTTQEWRAIVESSKSSAELARFVLLGDLVHYRNGLEHERDDIASLSNLLTCLLDHAELDAVERKPGRSKLVYDKAKRTIDAVALAHGHREAACAQHLGGRPFSCAAPVRALPAGPPGRAGSCEIAASCKFFEHDTSPQSLKRPGR